MPLQNHGVSLSFLFYNDIACLVAYIIQAALFGKTFKLFHARFSPTVLYVACTVLACCLIACLLLGSALFAYYCMFAAIAIELIGAVYYTFQLK